MLKKICQCLGLASLILVGNYGELLGGGAEVRMHYPERLTWICLAQIADIFLLGLMLFAILTLLERTRFYGWVRLVVAILIPPYLLLRTESFLPWDLPDGTVPIFAMVWAALLLLMMLRFRKTYRRLMIVGSMTTFGLAAFTVSCILQLLWVATWKPGPQQKVAAWTATPQPPREHPLLVWIIFDELSYDQVFEHRAHELELPNFDALKGESATFTNVQPAGYHTKEVIPSLLTGEPVVVTRFARDNRFFVRYADRKGRFSLDGAGTVFGDAQKNGWRTAVVGWYNPYCTTYGDALDSCYFGNRDMIAGPMAIGNSFAMNTYVPLKELYVQLKSPTRANRQVCSYEVKQRYETHIDLEQHWMQLLHTDQADFVFLHFSMPHSPNIWSRIHDDYTQKCGSSYLDNLALADRELGKVLGILQGSPRWDKTTLIVEGDHGWRIDLWDWLPAWTDEDDTASRGVFDPRAALLIHQAGQTQPQTVAAPWPLIQVHNVVEDVLRGQPVTY